MRIHPPRALPATINIHLTRSCNFGCRFCYAGFAECGSTRLTTTQVREIIHLLAAESLPADVAARKVNFAGGEPFLHPGLIELIRFAKSRNFTTSVVTNGSTLSDAVIARLAGALDICALSIDSGVMETNRAIGRCGKTLQPDAFCYLELGHLIRSGGSRLKINTVVNRLNLTENLGALVASLDPFRWKLFQVKRVLGQNDTSFDGLAVSDVEFAGFVEHNRRLVPENIAVISETAEDMTASYAMIAPNGCFFDSVHGSYRYSRPILDVGIGEAFQDIEFSAEKFLRRGGRYE